MASFRRTGKSADGPDNGPHHFSGRLIVTFLFPK
jgi:hypothetical protein